MIKFNHATKSITFYDAHIDPMLAGRILQQYKFMVNSKSNTIRKYNSAKRLAGALKQYINQ